MRQRIVIPDERSSRIASRHKFCKRTTKIRSPRRAVAGDDECLALRLKWRLYPRLELVELRDPPIGIEAEDAAIKHVQNMYMYMYMYI
jgi:hypothetical protein